MRTVLWLVGSGLLASQLGCATVQPGPDPTAPQDRAPRSATPGKAAPPTATPEVTPEEEMEAAPLTDEDAEKEDETDLARPPAVERRATPKPDRIKRNRQPKRPTSSLPGRQFIAQPGTSPLLRVHFIDIGQGDATLIECPNGNKILVDFGTHTGGQAAARKYLREVLSGDKIDDLVITHPDGDHYNQLHYGLEGTTVDQAWIVGKWSDYSGSANKASRQWLEAMEQNGRLQHFDASGPHHDVDAPHPGFDCGDADVWIAAAGVVGKNPSWRKNTMSVVLIVSLGDFDVVLTGDATGETEDAMIDWHCGADWKPGDPVCWLKSEVLKMGHHGSKWTSTFPRWAAAVAPEVAVASATKHIKHGHPSKEAVERLHPYTGASSVHPLRWWLSKSQPHDVDSYNESVFSTADDGHIYVESDGKSYRVIP